MRIVIIGTGNTATVLGKKLRAAGHQIVQVVGRSAKAAHVLAEQLGAAYTTSTQQLDQTASLYIVAVTDAAIATVAATLSLHKKLVVHTAGSVSKEVLQAASDRYGVLYPLQSLRKEMEQLPTIPLLIDATNEEDLATINTLAASISPQVQRADDEQRLKLHVAAVIVSNFTNHLYTLAERYCAEEQANFSLLHPLISQVADRLQQASPASSQTGPAIRRDEPTIQKHLELLQPHGELKDLYAWFTQSIQRPKEI
ncbi:Rossmann-like and DUF2520 domain-containing protein [Paraflavitalea pollutisoli]|uniref:Rossmann-like and DUF2520 domain-containing protein n=1 Tax=Paraflavitalea pollutisoli TaxID=3034143 RepID=UPI0023EB66D4|nr:Rossmann-like and DUF2520 domain-containing protein [Paraflavitalea sp. H1-2-19X]